MPIPLAQGGRLVCIPAVEAAGGKPRPYDVYGNTDGFEQSIGPAEFLNRAWRCQFHVGPGFTPGRAGARESGLAANLSEGDRHGPHFSPMFVARVARCCEMLCFRRMSERGVLDVLRTNEPKKVPQIAAHRGPQQKVGEKGGLGRISVRVS